MSPHKGDLGFRKGRQATSRTLDLPAKSDKCGRSAPAACKSMPSDTPPCHHPPPSQRRCTRSRRLLGEEVLLDVDHYWHLPVEAAVDMTTEPPELTGGQVSDDLETVRDRTERVPQEASHELAHLVGVLRALELAARS